jgi:uncharacterized glyoxalase superfamily protein PhnB
VSRIVPMIHVPDVRATVDWYQGIGFSVNETYGDAGDGLSFAILSFGSSEVMFNQGGRSSTRDRREVDLYLYTDKVDDLFSRLKDRVEVLEGPHDTFYGMREFIIRDLNRFWITFAQPSVFQVFMQGVREGRIEVVRTALQSGSLKPEALTAAMVVAKGETAELLRNAGALPPPEIGGEVFKSCVGRYRSEQGLVVDVQFKDDQLVAVPSGQQPMNLIAVDKTTFRPTAFDDVTLSFRVEEGKAIGFTLKQGPNTVPLKRVLGPV